jgi:two-component system OmpR family response regulator
VIARILIVDDEPALCHTLERLVTTLGFEGVAVGEASVAYEMLNGGVFDLVLLDLHLPQISGDALYLALVRRWPRLRGRIVLMTGDPTAVRTDWPTELIDCPVLSKPFTLDALKNAIKTVLAAAQADEGGRRAGGHA